MSKVFWDNIVVVEEIDIHIKAVAKSEKHRSKLRKRIDELLHTRILRKIFDSLPFDHHHDFLDKFHKAPYDEELINYLSEKMEKDAEDLIKEEVEEVKKELQELLQDHV